MPKPLRLGLSGSAFLYAMPRELITPAYINAVSGRLEKLNKYQNNMMADFMRDMMHVMNTMDIDAMECYHSVTWDNEPILEIMLDNPNIEFWSVHAPYGRYIDPSSPEEEAKNGAIEGYTDAVNVAKRLGARVVVAHPGSNTDYDVSKQTRLEITAETIKKVADTTAESGIKIAVEPLPKQEPGNSLDEVLWIIERINRDNVGINFDVNHLFPPEDIPSLIRKAGDKIFSVHISDQDGQERHWLPFMGTLDWKEILTALTETGYQGPLIYETHIRDAKTCEDVGRVVVENYKRLSQLI